MRHVGMTLALCGLLAAGCATHPKTEVAVAVDADVESVEVQTIEEPVVTSTTVTSTTTTHPGNIQLPAVLSGVQFLTPGLDKYVVVQKNTYQRTPTNTYEVLCSLKNLTNEHLKLQVRTQFFTPDRLHTEGPGAWQILYLPPNGIETYISRSLTTQDQLYHIEVLELN